MKLYYTSVLYSLKDQKIYIGFTENLKKRIKNNKSGKINSTKNRLPIKLIYYKACPSKELAILREKQLKTGFGRAYLKRRLQGIV